MTAAEMKQLFASFTGRNEALRHITRYDPISVMLYRTNDYNHSLRVGLLIDATLETVRQFFPDFDSERAQLLGLVHDDAEMIIGDVSAGHKSVMSDTLLDDLDNQERAAIEVLSKRFPRLVGKYSYHDLLVESFKVKTIEAQVMKYADKMDALGETYHELYGGNYMFAQGRSSPYGMVRSPIAYYYDYYWIKFFNDFPALQGLLRSGHPFFTQPQPGDYVTFAKEQAPHTEASLRQPTGNAFYDFWKRVVLTSGDDELIHDLSTQTEFLPTDVHET